MSDLLKDRDIREPLFDYLENEYGKIRIIEEKTMGKSRADVVMVTPEALVGIEIKSDADSYARLSRQVKDYDKYYDFNIVVVGSTHGLHIREHVPEHWGVITVELDGDELDFYTLRKPVINPHMDWNHKLEILWRPELAELQEIYGMPKYKDRKKAFVAEKILEKTDDRKELQRHISHILFERDYTVVKETLMEYRKGEIQKLLDQEEDPQKRLEYMVKQASMGKILTQRGFKKKRRRRRK